MTFRATRTVTELERDSAKEPESKSLQDYDHKEAYVLLGAPGIGKTTEFKRESDRQQDACYETARDFIALTVKDEWKSKTLFIDGLDEMRTDASEDPRQPLDQIRSRLDELGTPRFRLSCRNVKWLGSSDETALNRILKTQELILLRLNPLTEEDILFIAQEWDAEDLVQAVRDRGLSSLLENPLTLDLLLKAGRKEDLPDTLSQTLDQGCIQLSQECNPEHRVASAHSAATDDLLIAAGHSCAIILIAGLDGLSLPSAMPTKDAPALIEISGVNQEVLQTVLGTRLFEVCEGVARPYHRQIAEYLAAMYLTKCVSDGLSPGRILAILTDDHARTAAPLRGLAAWLAVLCPKLRLPLIQRDPVGVVSYGDVKGFSIDEKHRLLSELEKSAQMDPGTLAGMGEGDDMRWGFLATSGMEGIFSEYLFDPSRIKNSEWLSYALLDALRHAQTDFGMGSELLDIVRSNGYSLEFKIRVIKAFCTRFRSTEADIRLKRLLEDVIDNQRLPDRGNLVEVLLQKLYPRVLSAAELPRYLVLAPGTENGIKYDNFWWTHVRNESTPSQLAELLNSLVTLRRENGSAGRFTDTHSDSFSSMFCGLLIELLEKADRLDADDLYDCLTVATDNGELPHEVENVLVPWLKQHGTAYKAIVRKSVAASDNPEFDFYWLFSEDLIPEDYTAWCLGMACQVSDEGSVDFYLRQACHHSPNKATGSDKLSKLAQETLAGHPVVLDKYLRISTEYAETEASRDIAASERHRRRVQKDEAKYIQRRDYIKTNEKALLGNQAPPQLLNHLANVYFSEVPGIQGKTPLERLGNYLSDNNGLADTALGALRNTPMRPDLPIEEEILELVGTDQGYLISHPYLAGLQENLQGEGSLPDWFNKMEKRRALAFQLSVLPLTGQESRPSWYRNLLENEPHLVADMFEKVGRRFFRSSLFDFPQLYELSNADHEQVARMVVIPLLRTFPMRPRKEKLHVLGFLLSVAKQLIDERDICKLVESKLANKSMMQGQKVYWLCAGLTIDIKTFAERLNGLFEGSRGERLILHITGFFSSFTPPGHSYSIESLPVPAAKLLIEILGRVYTTPGSDGSVNEPGYKVNASVMANNLINALAANPEPEAFRALDSLAMQGSLGHLSARLKQEVERHRMRFPTSAFVHPDLVEVIRFLENQQPANAADLMAVTADLIDQLADRIRNEDTSDWRQYWQVNTEGSGNSGWQPLKENSCRDQFLSDLRLTLPPEIKADKEALYVNDMRSDIRVTFQDFEIPIEAKRSKATDMYTAIDDQLILKYTRSPGARGCGIYLVFWFGKEYCKVPPVGPKPKSPEELQAQLESSLTQDKASKILVRVIDVSRQ